MASPSDRLYGNNRFYQTRLNDHFSTSPTASLTKESSTHSTLSGTPSSVPMTSILLFPANCQLPHVSHAHKSAPPRILVAWSAPTWQIPQAAYKDHPHDTCVLASSPCSASSFWRRRPVRRRRRKELRSASFLGRRGTIDTPQSS